MATEEYHKECEDKSIASEGGGKVILTALYGERCHVLNVHDDVILQKEHGVDLLLLEKLNDKLTGKNTTVQVKSGINNSSVLVELTNGDDIGWFYKPNATWMMFYKPNNKYAVFVKFDSFKDWILNDAQAKQYLVKRQTKDYMPWGIKYSDVYWIDILRVKQDLNPSWLKWII